MSTRLIAAGLGLGCVLGSSVRAQTDIPKVEIGAGYQYLYDKEADQGTSFPAGWVASLNGNVNDWLGLMAEFSGSYKSERDSGFQVKKSVYAFMGGLRFAKYVPRGAAFFQMLAGGARLKASAEAPGVSIEDSTTKFAIQPGIGLDGRLTDHLRIRIGGDYRLIFTDVEKTNEWRAHAGFVFTFGPIS
jgi:opacity protein-like surface antigen